MIWVDTSVWVDHFKNRNEDLVHLLVSDSALIHLLIIAELACGTPA
jgi:predicted nucleic acid-binding protein